MNYILEQIYRIVVSDPSRQAYVSGNAGVSYGELWDMSAKCAGYLKRQGASPVIIYGDKNKNVVISIIACIMSGRAYVPVSTGMPFSRLRNIIELSSSSLMLSETDVAISGIDVCGLTELSRFSGNAEQEHANDIAYIIFTSGSTGDPKGVPISYSNLENFIKWIGSLSPLCDYRGKIVFNQASFSFDLSVADFYYSLCNGHTLTASPGNLRGNPAGIMKTLASANVAVITPTFARLCLLDSEFNSDNYPDLECIYFCGETLDVLTVRRLFKAFPGLKIINAYGPTEATSAVTAVGITPEMAENTDLLPVGSISHSAVFVCVEDGEIVLRGKSVFNGYLDGSLNGCFFENGTRGYRTGDLGEIMDGLLYCFGRKDRQVKYQGYRIELDDIERNLRKINGIKDCAVIAKKNPDGTTRLLKAFVVTDDPVGPSEIREKLMASVPEYMIPKTFSVVEALPVNANGKTDRKELEQW